MLRIINHLTCLVLIIAWSTAAFASDQKVATKSPLNIDVNSEPTYIKSDTLTLRSGERVFVYSGNVEVKQGDMTLTSKELEGSYDENNKIQKLIAKTDVLILKGETIRATGQHAVYTAGKETLVLTENPELTQEGSVLTADSITIFLNEDRSVAEGEVRVKVVNSSKDSKTQPE